MRCWISYNACLPMNFKRAFFLTFAFGMCISIGFTGGYLTREHISSKSNSFTLLDEAFGILRVHGLKPIPDDFTLEHGMIRGMLQSYEDPFTVFLEPVEHELESNALQGSFGGIGVRLIRDSQGDVVLFPYADSPAIQAGINEGDRLITVDDLSIEEDSTLESIQAALRGPVGTLVLVSVSSPPSNQAREFAIKRAEIAIPSVTWHLDPDIAELGVIEINLIAASTVDEVERAINELSRQGASSFVMDLRNNYGGLLTAGVEIVRLFLSDGIVMEHQYRGKDVEVFRVDRRGPFSELPLVVLVNENTASAAEIVAGALQANHRAQIIGASTFGKDTIQLVFELEDGSSMHVTAARWWIPGLVPPIGEFGLQPDILVKDSLDPKQYDSAMKIAAELLFR